MKVVINNCYGGFSLSEKAVLRYAELKGITIYVNKGKYGFPEYLTVPPEQVTPSLENWHTATSAEKKASNDAYAREHFSDREIKRDDPLLVQIVEELGGEEAGGMCADLKVVDVPDDVDWAIEEYDGNEWVSEKHRRWS
jgi:hypothetical protein